MNPIYLFATLILLMTGSATGASGAEFTAPGDDLAAGPELECQYCWDDYEFCPPTKPDFQYYTGDGPPDATILQISSSAMCFDSEGGCESLIECGRGGGSNEWDEADTEAALNLRTLLESGYWEQAAELIAAQPHLGEYVSERDIMIVKASPCVGGVLAVVPVRDSSPFMLIWT